MSLSLCVCVCVSYSANSYSREEGGDHGYRRVAKEPFDGTALYLKYGDDHVSKHIIKLQERRPTRAHKRLQHGWHQNEVNEFPKCQFPDCVLYYNHARYYHCVKGNRISLYHFLQLHVNLHYFKNS